MIARFEDAAAAEFIAIANGLIAKGVKEDVLRHELSAHLPAMFPDRPWWVQRHSRGAEETLRFDRGGRVAAGFVDALVGATVIEYEKNLRDAALAVHGQDQVRDYCAGLVNQGVPDDQIVGVLSDTIRWRAYEIRVLRPMGSIPGSSTFGRDHIALTEVDSIDAGMGTAGAAQLGAFLQRWLGRLGARPLNAQTLAFDLGFESTFCAGHTLAIRTVVDTAFTARPSYAQLIEKVWSDFISYVGGSGATGSFDRDTYASELYILTLAKLLCANVLESKSLALDDDQLASVLDGGFFKLRGITNLVEYDYFGWLNAAPHVARLLPVARQIQEDLAAYNFTAVAAEDLFGTLMAQLAKRSQRLLLGQEWTPAWLAKLIVTNVFEHLPSGESPRLLDMCCGSGAMIVETVKLASDRLHAVSAPKSPKTLATLAGSITGFDIDPMAVLLSKVGWILAARPWLVESGGDVTIPIYHADTLFASTPLARSVSDIGGSSHALDFDGQRVSLPTCLLTAENGSLFDSLIELAYGMAKASSRASNDATPENLAADALTGAMVRSEAKLTDEQFTVCAAFLVDLIASLESLERRGRNGIWAFILRNSYRPALVGGRFNGLVSNPPWLAMSKVADNPYKTTLGEIAVRYAVKPEGASHLHLELATIFLLHAVDRYLAEAAQIGCVLPESVLSAHHHNPFRRGQYLRSTEPVAMVPREIWRVQKGTFKNEAIVLFATRLAGTTGVQTTLVGGVAGPTGVAATAFTAVTQGLRTAWTDNPDAISGATGFFRPADFRQGADIFPRTCIFHSISEAGGRIDVTPIHRDNSPARYLVSDAKKLHSFSLSAKGVDPSFLFPVLLSHHLTPFRLGTPASALLPVRRDGDGRWAEASETRIAASGSSTKAAFDTIFEAAGTDSAGYFRALDTNRQKLRSQVVPEHGWLVFTGAGGSNVCAAFAPVADLPRNRLIIDQTLYWAPVASEDEALYLAGLLNSDAISSVIREFQPRGQFGERHVHTLPFGATPKFEPSEAAHADVVGRTRALLASWNRVLSSGAAARSWLDPNWGSLAGRRTKIRAAIHQLPEFAAYDAACRSLYGL